MATNKNQHFVPRCYLKQFTDGGANKAISLYNIDQDRYIQAAPVKNQCSRDYFYGQDHQLEKAIQSVEAQYARTSAKILAPSYKLLDEDRDVLKIFWLFQYLRTEAASKRAVQMSASVMAVAQVPEENFRMQIAEAVQVSMQAFASSMGIVSDLKVCLVRNRTNVPFVTSDDPAILTNRWRLHNVRLDGPSFGLSSAGNLLILPISPKVLFFAYDGDIHSFPHTGGWVDVSKEADIDALNQHQYLNARANIYVRSPEHFECVRSAFKKVMQNRLIVRHRINYAIPDKEEGGYIRYVVVDPKEAKSHENALIHSESLHPQPLNWPTLLKWRSTPYAYSNGTGVGYVRRAVVSGRSSTDAPFRKIRVSLG
jgi:hypothetical protein